MKIDHQLQTNPNHNPNQNNHLIDGTRTWEGFKMGAGGSSGEMRQRIAAIREQVNLDKCRLMGQGE